MPGAQISRWSMAYFASAIGFLIVALAAIAIGYGYPADDLLAPDTLAIVHLIVLGWLGLLFSGALLQFVPVLTGSRERYAWFAAPALLVNLAGIFCLVMGFLSLGGHVAVEPSIMALAPGFFVTGFGGLTITLGVTIIDQRPLELPSRLLLVAIASLIVTIVLGWLFASALSGLLSGAWVADLLVIAVPLHAGAGLLGFMGLAAIGVSYRLFSMFMLAPEKSARPRLMISVAVAAILLLLAAISAALLESAWSTTLAKLALLAALACAGLYVSDLHIMVRIRHRPALELNITASLASKGHLVGGLLLLAAAQFPGASETLAPAAFFLLAMGWLTGLGLAQLYKIIPFLTWMEAYGPAMGKSRVPRVQDLVLEKNARPAFVLYHVGTVISALGMMAIDPADVRIGALLQLSAVCMLAVEYLRARRLTYVPQDIRMPQGTVMPHLLFANLD